MAHALASRGDKVVAVGESKNMAMRWLVHAQVFQLGYPPPEGSSGQTHQYLRGLEAHVRRGQLVFRTLAKLASEGFRPDVVVAHPGWGEALFLKDVFAKARHIQYLEFFYRAEGADVGFDPEFPVSADDTARVRVKNATQLISFEAADGGISPTAWQKSRYPADWQGRIAQIHDGIDTDTVRPYLNARVVLKSDTGNQILSVADEVVTYVARNLEPYRGIHTFLRSIPTILAKRPKAHILIVGGDDVSYGSAPPDGNSYRARYLKEWGGDVDTSRVHFLGRIAYAQYLQVLQISTVHVYLTYPFVLSWSMLEAMSAGCVVVGSNTAPVQEVIHDGHNGFLVDFFDASKLAVRVAETIAARNEMTTIRTEARATILENYDLKRLCLPQILDYLGSRGGH